MHVNDEQYTHTHLGCRSVVASKTPKANISLEADPAIPVQSGDRNGNSDVGIKSEYLLGAFVAIWQREHERPRGAELGHDALNFRDKSAVG